MHINHEGCAGFSRRSAVARLFGIPPFAWRLAPLGEQVLYAMLGLLMTLAVFAAAFSGWVLAGRLAPDSDWAPFIGAAVLGSFCFALDRMFAVGAVQSQGGWKWSMAVMRIGWAGALAAAVAIAADLWLFEQPIRIALRKELSTLRDKASTDAERQLNLPVLRESAAGLVLQEQQAVAALQMWPITVSEAQRDLAICRTAEQRAWANWRRLQDQYAPESEVESAQTRAQRQAAQCARRAKEVDELKQGHLRDAQARLDGVRGRLENARKELADRERNAVRQADHDVRVYGTAVREDLPQSLRALLLLMDSDPEVRLIARCAFLLMLLFDLAPLVAKLLMPGGVLEAAVRAESAEGLRTLIERRLTAELIADGLERARHDAEVRAGAHAYGAEWLQASLQAMRATTPMRATAHFTRDAAGAAAQHVQQGRAGAMAEEEPARPTQGWRHRATRAFQSASDTAARKFGQWLGAMRRDPRTVS